MAKPDGKKGSKKSAPAAKAATPAEPKGPKPDYKTPHKVKEVPVVVSTDPMHPWNQYLGPVSIKGMLFRTSKVSHPKSGRESRVLHAISAPEGTPLHGRIRLKVFLRVPEDIHAEVFHSPFREHDGDYVCYKLLWEFFDSFYRELGLKGVTAEKAEQEEVAEA